MVAALSSSRAGDASQYKYCAYRTFWTSHPIKEFIRCRAGGRAERVMNIKRTPRKYGQWVLRVPGFSGKLIKL